jgi:hypothetical protein
MSLKFHSIFYNNGCGEGFWYIKKQMESYFEESRYVPNLVTACICLHNLCIIHKDKFNLDWTKEGERLMQRESLERIGQLEKPVIFMAAAEAAK